jgi:hypothetical protein
MHYRKRPDSFQSRHRAGRVIGGRQWRAADRRCASRCGHSSRRGSEPGVAFVDAFCRRNDSQGVRPRSFELEDQQSREKRGTEAPRQASSSRCEPGRLAEPTKSPELRAPIRDAADGIVSTAAEFRGAPSPRALDLLQELEPDLKEGAATFMRSHPSFSDMVRPNAHGGEISPI